MKNSEFLNTKILIDKLYINNSLEKNELKFLLKNLNPLMREYLIEKAFETRKKIYGKTVYFRGLMEITNICKHNCLYCGIRAKNSKADRYSLSKETILNCCFSGYNLGYRTFVLQGGENSKITDEFLIDIISILKNKFKDIAITLSLGERGKNSFKKLYDAGADRYLIRHETFNKKLYKKLHPNMSYKNRIKSLYILKKIGYQVGSGFLIGLPSLKLEDYYKDLIFLKKLKPHMIGIGPFIPHINTPLKNEKGGSSYDTITLIAILRLLLPDVLLPATTALVTLDPNSRNLAFRAGANVIMPNISPLSSRKKYTLYNGKAFLGDEAGEEMEIIIKHIKEAGFIPVLSKGDNVRWKRK